MNPLIKNSSNAFYPDKCLSSGCAKWACISSIEFVDNFAIYSEMCGRATSQNQNFD
ncbi:MAG: hypothetical protein ABF289_10590 [Clostridiales bacterium]